MVKVLYGLLWSCMVQFHKVLQGPVWLCIILYSTVVLFGYKMSSVWFCLGINDISVFLVVLNGPVSFCLVLVGPIYSCVYLVSCICSHEWSILVLEGLLWSFIDLYCSACSMLQVPIHRFKPNRNSKMPFGHHHHPPTQTFWKASRPSRRIIFDMWAIPRIRNWPTPPHPKVLIVEDYIKIT